jgi:uncharacterized iron-regulated membrane protein
VSASGLDVLLSRAKKQSEHWKAITMYLPDRDSDPADFAIDMSGYSGVGAVSSLRLDRTGRVLLFTPAGNNWISAPTLIRYGHTGEAWGVAGQTIAGAASLCGALLVWTGACLSLRRLKSWLTRTKKAASPVEDTAGEARYTCN